MYPLPPNLSRVLNQTTSDLNRAVQKAQASCDHDWEDIGKGRKQCTYPGCQKIEISANDS